MTKTHNDAFRVLNEIGIISQLSANAMERALPHDLTMSQYGVLNHLSRLSGETSPLRLANAFQVTKGAMTNTLQKLEAQKFIRIAPNPDDGRAKLVTLTKKGARAHQDAINAVSPQLKQLCDALGVGNFTKALPFLSRLRAFLDEARS